MGGAIVLGERHVEIYSNVLPDEKIFRVANFAEDSLFTDRRSIDRKFSAMMPLRLLFLSNLIPGKGYEELVDAFLSLDAHDRSAVVLDLAGSFESDSQKQAFLQRISGISQIQYHGPVRGDLRRALYHGAHVFCLPTYYPYEGQPISILEAYASGCAVITTDHSGIGDIFSPDINGYQVMKRSSDDLKAAIERALASPERLRGMADENLRAANANYRTSSYNSKLLRIIRTLASD
jgi:glycosyltransferase involved in cell wall biosynthesis